ncbi:hypothetical protein GGI07_004728 [Coemansia sp. Benny D115]|nr:hypothetical protein GGI07_004728 [Coemansia sp. Benny D115]
MVIGVESWLSASLLMVNIPVMSSFGDFVNGLGLNSMAQSYGVYNSFWALSSTIAPPVATSLYTRIGFKATVTGVLTSISSETPGIMQVVALVSGGKDSSFNMVKCVENGHEIVALAHIHPPLDSEKDELDSFMYQTVGSSGVKTIAECMELPLYLQETKGKAVTQELEYEKTEDDETEDLFTLLSTVKRAHPDVQGVSVGAIFSKYQANRVQNVCERLGLTMLAYLWERNQRELLREMIESGVEAVLIKVAASGLKRQHLGKTLAEMEPVLLELESRMGIHVCGEGGEFETFTLDCPLYKRRIVLDEVDVVMHADIAFSPVLYLSINKAHTESKQQ